ncbi:polyamine-modulated factor 1-binding protein 1 [Cucurbita maxima]|uniref:Polyamine-modulated factor 1-binding protein 1 n=1 Tax=Cucurbita maxima TaxID=3661 RepID=A0A6J1HKX2_CUCMA|nr:polyamine-modulated factor 1-binding protein 1 [Cucurbita maxima]
MAKKKPTRSGNEPKKVPDHQEENRDSEQQLKSAVDESVEKSQLQSLKSLNERLLKETHEKRKEFGALVQAKEGLELDLKKNADEKKQVMCELSVACDGVSGLELEKNVVHVYLQTQMEEMGGVICRLVESEREKNVEIGRLKGENNGLVLKAEEEREKWMKVCSERDGIKADFDGLFEETGDLRRKMVEMEKNERRALEEIEDLKVKCKKLSGEKMESEITNGTLLKEKELVKRLLDESGRVIEDLERKVDLKTKEKVEIEKEKKALEMEIERLGKEVAELNESSFCLKQEKEENGKAISEFVKIIEEAVEKENGLLLEVDGFVKELHKKEKDVEMLTQQRDSVNVNLNRVEQEAVSLRRTIEIITCEKAEMEEAKMEAESIVEDLRRESSKLKESVTSLTESSGVEKARNKELLSQMGCLREALNGVSLERDKLGLLLEDKERRIEEAMAELEKTKTAWVESMNVAKERERRIEVLVGERDRMEKSLLEAESRIDELKGKVKSAVDNSEKALALLKETCLSVCDGYEKEEGKSKPFVEHLDAIKASFMNKEKKMGEMKQCFETARAEERKKKNFFTLVTAATTILAAMSAAYFSRGRG